MSSQRIVVAYDRLDKEPGWAEFILGQIHVPVSINLDLAEGSKSNAFLWEKRPHLTYVRHYRAPVVLSDVRFSTFEGFRSGCNPTGLLGIADGEIFPFSTFPFPPIAVKFDPNAGHFIRLDTRREVVRCPFLLLTRLGAYGHFPPPANTLQQHIQKGEYFEPNASV